MSADLAKLPKTYKALVFTAPNTGWDPVDVPMPTSLPDAEVLIKVDACGICHSDLMTITGSFAALGATYPRVPGHEVVGRIVARGAGVHDRYKIGQLVGVGWEGGHCGECKACRKAAYACCEKLRVTGIHRDGGYAEYMTAHQDSLAVMPEDVKPTETAPLLCAGVTVYNAMRNCNVQAGGVCAVAGVGGLGHLGIQVANKMGFKTIAISTSDSKRALAKELGAHEYIDTSKENAVEYLKKHHNGADLIVCTAPYADQISSLVPALTLDGTIMVVAAPFENVSFSVFPMIFNRTSFRAWASGSAVDSEQAVDFAKTTGVKCYIETVSLNDAKKGVDSMEHNKVRFRGVIKF